jgi:F0F1-type ATP synthase beta subunit
MSEPITTETIRTLAAVAGIYVPEEDEEALAAGLRDHLAALDDLTRRLDLDNIDPAVHFDPRWP